VIDTTAKDFRIGGQPAYFLGKNIHQFSLCIRPAIGEPLLEVIPHTFVGIQFGGVRWKAHQVKAVGAREEFLDRVTAVYLAIVPQNDYVAWNLM
jgi:hypothetical protein